MFIPVPFRTMKVMEFETLPYFEPGFMKYDTCFYSNISVRNGFLLCMKLITFHVAG